IKTETTSFGFTNGAAVTGYYVCFLHNFSFLLDLLCSNRSELLLSFRSDEADSFTFCNATRHS
ncbi:MAG: hypothetical protein ABUT20_22940, partial [Bacteroidota bacterium]